MPYSKRELIYAALEEIGIASYNFDLQAEQVLSAGNMLDAMMAEWDARGIHVGYPITSPTTIDLDASVGFPAWVNEAARTGLAPLRRCAAAEPQGIRSRMGPRVRRWHDLGELRS
jgi:hypothetical protein